MKYDDFIHYKFKYKLHGYIKTSLWKLFMLGVSHSLEQDENYPISQYNGQSDNSFPSNYTVLVSIQHFSFGLNTGLNTARGSLACEVYFLTGVKE